MTVTVSATDLTHLCAQAARRAGADQRAADSLATATVAAEQAGKRAVGVAHLFDYLQAYREGRIRSGVVPEIVHPAPGWVIAEAHNGLAQVAFDVAVSTLVAATRQNGIAALWLRNCFTCGELGHYPRQLAKLGFLGLACANSPALMSLGGSKRPVLGTNPLAYAAPRPGRSVFVVDQASSETAYVNVREAARADETIPPGWAVGPDGAATTDAAEALRGALLPFGGYRGGNIALLVELLATLAGASFSLDAPPFDRGQAPPGIGVFVLSINLELVADGTSRFTAYLDRLQSVHGVSLPAMTDTAPTQSIRLDPGLHQRLLAACAEPA